MTLDHWDAMIDVHLNGSYQVIKAVWPHFCRQRYGRIVNTTSTSGIYGSFGQANYSAAKLGILGLSEVMAREGIEHNIRVNTIAPVASTALFLKALEGTADKNAQPNFKPEYVVPIMILLCSDQETSTLGSTGGLYEVGCGWTAATRLRPAEVYVSGVRSSFTPKEFLSNWHSLGDSLQTQNSNSFSTLQQPDLTETTQYYSDSKDIILYNLSVGASASQLNLVYESNPLFQPVPTFGCIPPFASRSMITHHNSRVSNFSVDRSLLGELYLELLHYPLPTSGQLSTTRQPISILSKANAAVAITGYTTSTAVGTPIFYSETHFFMLGARAPSGSPRSDSRNHPAARSYPTPTTPPTHTTTFRTTPEQAALYRLNGDFAPVHIDRIVVQRAGHPEPIFHGHCTLGIAVRCIWERYENFKSIKARFVSVVYTGQYLRVNMWRNADGDGGLVKFQVVVIEEDRVCISGGALWLLELDAENGRGVRANL